MAPRITPEDFRSPEELASGDWVRTPWYSGGGHRLSADLETFHCGRPLMTEERYLSFIEQLTKLSGGHGSYGPWYLAIDSRQSGKCTVCKTDLPVSKKAALEPARERVPFVPPTEVRARVRWLKQIQHAEVVRQLLGATTVEDWTQEKELA